MAEMELLNGRYRLDEPLGTGGMATVYRAYDLMLERSVAIKLLHIDLSSDVEFRERFKQEARAAGGLSHPNIVTVHDFGWSEDRLFIVMENVPGADLKAFIQERGRFSIADALELAVQACAGLGYAHRAGVVHCDVKPQNMLVTPDMRLKVVDFGIARVLASISPEEYEEIVWGSPLYFSPEQSAGSPPSPASDVYSLGVVMFEMLTGQPPFSASSAEELGRMHRDTPPPSARLLNPAIPAELEQILLKALAKPPEARYRTADQLGNALQAFEERTAAVEASPGLSLERPIEAWARPEYGVPANAQASPWEWEGDPIYASSHPAASSPPGINVQEFDWGTWFLAFLAFIAVGGLIPFGLWVFYALSPLLP